MRVSRLNVSTAAFSVIPAMIARRTPKPIFEARGFRTCAISSRLGSERLNVLPVEEGAPVIRGRDSRLQCFQYEIRIRKRILKKRVHNTGRNHPETEAEAPIPKSIAPKARVATIAQRTPWLQSE